MSSEIVDLRFYKYIKTIEPYKNQVSKDSFDIQLEWFKRNLEKADSERSFDEFFRQAVIEINDTRV